MAKNALKVRSKSTVSPTFKVRALQPTFLSRTLSLTITQYFYSCRMAGKQMKNRYFQQTPVNKITKSKQVLHLKQRQRAQRQQK
jgi:hypothetical protein